MTVPLKTEDFLTKTLRFDWIEYTGIVKSKHKIHLTFSLVPKKFDDIYLKLIRWEGINYKFTIENKELTIAHIANTNINLFTNTAHKQWISPVNVAELPSLKFLSIDILNMIWQLALRMGVILSCLSYIYLVFLCLNLSIIGLQIFTVFLSHIDWRLFAWYCITF